MDYGFSDQQEMFRTSVRDFLGRECPKTLVREIEDNKLDYSRELYSKMADLGWLSLMIPEEYGGLGGDWVDMAIFYEEAGRVLLQSPHLTTIAIGGQAILTFGTEEQKRSLLPKLSRGEIIVALALTEPDAGSNLSLLATAAVREGHDYIITGTKLFISNAHIADDIIAVTRTDSGITLFWVDGKSEGLSCTPLDTLSGEGLSEVVFDKVRVPEESMLGEINKGEGIAAIGDKAKIMTCAEMMGGAQVTLEMAIEYSTQRVQFGQPIGSFQALQHKMANMAMAIEGARWLVYYVAWLNSQGIPCAKESAMAQLRAGEAYRFVTAEAGQIHGGMGMMREHDWGLYFRRAKAAQLNLGASDVHREAIAASLGL